MATKKKKYPKLPKSSASLQVWENYRDKCKDVDKYNSNLETEKKKKQSIIEAVKKMKK